MIRSPCEANRETFLLVSTAGDTLVATGASCTASADCCSGLCDGTFTCIAKQVGCASLGSGCGSRADCCSGSCVAGFGTVPF